MCWLDPDFEPEHGDEPNDSDHELAEEPSAHKRRYEFAIAPGDNPVERWEPLPAARRRALLGIDCCREGPDAADPGDAEEDRFEDLIEAGFTHRYPVPGACGFRAGGPLDVMLPGTPASPASTPASPAGPAPGPGALPGVNLTMPTATWLGYADRPGDITGTGAAGPADAGTCRHLADLMAASPATRWCLTL
ncbi:MAG TPA: hypothetical protein VMC03_22035, partial [Streptosporangiaceae bacterium]|nr:hypothetical protein [Streptosporangiaceae bacterium]